MNFPSQKQPRRSGFTIIELLVAVGVTALMVTLMLTIVVNVLGGWNRSSGSLTSGNQARLVLDQISRDLQSAIIKRDGNGWIVADIQQNPGNANVPDAEWTPTNPKPSGAGVTDPASQTTSLVIPTASLSPVPSIEDYRFGQGGVWLRFITTVPDTNETNLLHRISAPRAVAYQIVRIPVTEGSNTEARYQLFRSEVRPGHATLAQRSTFAVGYNLLDATTLYYNPTAQNSGASSNDGGEPGSIRWPDRDQLIANNVIDFGMRFWTRNPSSNPPNQLEIGFPRNTGDLRFAATTDTAAATTANVTSVGFPEFAEVFVRILTDEGATLISNLEEGLIPSTPEKWWEIALANSRVYSRRVEIKGTGL